MAEFSGVTIDGDINGNGTPAITIDAGGHSRVFDVDNGVSAISATLDGLVIRGGDSGRDSTRRPLRNRKASRT